MCYQKFQSVPKFFSMLPVLSRDYGLGRGTGVNLGVACGLGGMEASGRGAGVGRGCCGGVQPGTGTHKVTAVVSTRQPSPEPLLSLAIRQRNLPPWGRNGRLTSVQIKPPELPLHARRPAIGLPRSVLIVRL